MKAIGMIETKGLVPAIESADSMLKAAEVTLLERTFVKGGLVTITIAGDVAACKASVDAAASAVQRMGGTIISTHVIPRPHSTLSGLITAPIPGDDEDISARGEDDDDEESHSTEPPAPVTKENGGGGGATSASAVKEAPKAEVKAEPTEEVKSPAPKEAPKKEAKKAPAKKTEQAARLDRKALDAIVDKDGVDAAVKELEKVRVVALRTLAREYNGEFGISGREITLANKKALIEEFKKYFKNNK